MSKTPPKARGRRRNDAEWHKICSDFYQNRLILPFSKLSQLPHLKEFYDVDRLGKKNNWKYLQQQLKGMDYDWDQFKETYVAVSPENLMSPPLFSPPRPRVVTPPRSTTKATPTPKKQLWTNLTSPTFDPDRIMSDISSQMKEMAISLPEPAVTHQRPDFNGFNYLNLFFGVPFNDQPVDGYYYSGMTFYATPVLFESIKEGSVKFHFWRNMEEINGIYVQTSFPKILFQESNALHTDKDGKVPYSKIKEDTKIFYNGIASNPQFQTSNLLIKFPDATSNKNNKKFCLDHFHKGNRGDELKMIAKMVKRTVTSESGKGVEVKDFVLLSHVAFAEMPRRSSVADSPKNANSDVLDDFFG